MKTRKCLFDDRFILEFIKKYKISTSQTKKTEEIATGCGYASVSWFISKFKKEFTMTLKDFRHKS
jgi:YesN/AraC family two-component response regulator